MNSKTVMYKVDNPGKLSSWKRLARKDLYRWLTDEEYSNEIDKSQKSNVSPWTKFLYHFAGKCACGWGVMVDFNENTQRVYLVGRYFDWMSRLRSEMEAVLLDKEKYDK